MLGIGGSNVTTTLDCLFENAASINPGQALVHANPNLTTKNVDAMASTPHGDLGLQWQRRFISGRRTEPIRRTSNAFTSQHL